MQTAVTGQLNLQSTTAEIDKFILCHRQQYTGLIKDRTCWQLHDFIASNAKRPTITSYGDTSYVALCCKSWSVNIWPLKPKQHRM